MNVRRLPNPRIERERTFDLHMLTSPLTLQGDADQTTQHNVDAPDLYLTPACALLRDTLNRHRPDTRPILPHPIPATPLNPFMRLVAITSLLAERLPAPHHDAAPTSGADISTVPDPNYSCALRRRCAPPNEPHLVFLQAEPHVVNRPARPLAGSSYIGTNAITSQEHDDLYAADPWPWPDPHPALLIQETREPLSAAVP